MLQATQRPFDGHLLGVIGSTTDNGGQALLGVVSIGVNDTPEQFGLTTGEAHVLKDSWQMRILLSHATHSL